MLLEKIDAFFLSSKQVISGFHFKIKLNIDFNVSLVLFLHLCNLLIKVSTTFKFNCTV